MIRLVMNRNKVWMRYFMAVMVILVVMSMLVSVFR
jgi:hypothetical protein